MTEKRWKRYESHLLDGFWHVHTDRTDGTNSIDELVAFATTHGYPLIGFVEHVRREPTYDFEQFYRTAKDVAEGRGIDCVVGCEAKVLNSAGEIDVSAAVLDRADIVYAAYHGTPFERSEYLESVYETLANPVVDVWAHPFVYAMREGFDLSRDEKADVLAHAADHDVLVEYNLRYERDGAVPRSVADRYDIVGYDVHDLDRWRDVRPVARPAAGRQRGGER